MSMNACLSCGCVWGDADPDCDCECHKKFPEMRSLFASTKQSVVKVGEFNRRLEELAREKKAGAKISLEKEFWLLVQQAEKEFPDAEKYALFEDELEGRREYEKAIEEWKERWFGDT